jgi:hypothetical protein
MTVAEYELSLAKERQNRNRPYSVEATSPIDPGMELLRLKLTKEEIPLLVPFFKINWYLRYQPEYYLKTTTPSFPRSRSLLCAVVNDILGKDVVWPNSYSEEEWQDEDFILTQIMREGG